MCTDVLQTLLGRTPALQAARIIGYKRLKVVGQPYPGIIKTSTTSASSESERGEHEVEQVVEGQLIQDLTAFEMDVMDEFEDDSYTKQELQVEVVRTQSEDTTTNAASCGVELVNAYVYVYRDNYRHELSGEWSYKQHFLSVKSTYLDMCQRFIAEYHEDR